MAIGCQRLSGSEGGRLFVIPASFLDKQDGDGGVDLSTLFEGAFETQPNIDPRTMKAVVQPRMVESGGETVFVLPEEWASEVALLLELRYQKEQLRLSIAEVEEDCGIVNDILTSGTTTATDLQRMSDGCKDAVLEKAAQLRVRLLDVTVSRSKANAPYHSIGELAILTNDQFAEWLLGQIACPGDFKDERVGVVDLFRLFLETYRETLTQRLPQMRVQETRTAARIAEVAGKLPEDLRKAEEVPVTRVTRRELKEALVLLSEKRAVEATAAKAAAQKPDENPQNRISQQQGRTRTSAKTAGAGRRG